MNTTPELLSIPAVCEMLSLSDEAVRKLIRLGTIKSVELGPRTTRVVASSLSQVLGPDHLYEEAVNALTYLVLSPEDGRTAATALGQLVASKKARSNFEAHTLLNAAGLNAPECRELRTYATSL